MASDSLTKIRQLVAYQQHTLSPDAEDADWAYWNGKREENARLQPAIEALCKVVERYARHDISCDHYDASEGHDCTCGYSAALAALGDLCKEAALDER